MDLHRLQGALSGRYRVQEELGRGGMATVYLAEDLRHERQVALKVVRPEVVDLVGRERFLREIRITAGLAHPHIRPLLDSGEVDGAFFFTMPLAEGPTLAEWIEERGPLPVEEAVGLAVEIADALDYAHEHGIVHRDVKPSNVMLETGHAVLGDFGVALPVEAGARERMTGSGITLGTVEYMSPEQCAEGQPVDARSDIYSLGCVLHEMLTGQPPFTASNPAAVIAKHLREDPPPLRSLRAEVPEGLEAIVLQALAKDPDLRLQTAGEVKKALRGRRAPRSFQRPHSGMRTAGLILGILILLAALLTRPWERSPELDPMLYAVLPFQQDGAFQQEGESGDPDLNGHRCQTRLRESLERWLDVRPVNPMVIKDRVHRLGGSVGSLDQALELAEELGAGRLVWGTVSRGPDGSVVEGFLYDVASGSQIRQHRITVDPRGAGLGASFDELGDSLVVGQVETTPARASASGTRSLSALRLYDQGHQHLTSWSMEDAAAAFAAAAEEDPEYAQASLWRALLGMFKGEPTERWRRYAAAAARNAEDLSARERILARGMSDLAEGRWQEACASFEQAIARDEQSFDAWLGLGDCQARDPVVVASDSSPSGWRFRSSFHSATEAYLRALELAPSYSVILQDSTEQQLERVLPRRVGNFRVGRREGESTPSFGAHPELRGDTIAYVPRPLPELLSGPPGPATTRAVQHTRNVLAGITERWLQALPGSRLALEAHAQSLESLGRIATTGDPGTSALDAVRGARARVPSDSVAVAVGLAHLEARLLLKVEDFPRAAALADTFLARSLPRRARTGLDLAGLAILRGRAHDAADHLEATAAQRQYWHPEGAVSVPQPLRETSTRLDVFSAMGGPVDSLAAVRERAMSQAETQLPASERERVLEAATSEALALAYTVLPPRPSDPSPLTPGNHLFELAEAGWAGDARAVGELITEAEGRAVGLVAATAPMHVVFAEAHYLMMVGDTARAAARLDRALRNLRAQGETLTLPKQLGSLVRAMALRAVAAEAQGDRATGLRWARAVTTLWADGTEPATSVNEIMQGILRGGRP